MLKKISLLVSLVMIFSLSLVFAEEPEAQNLISTAQTNIQNEVSGENQDTVQNSGDEKIVSGEVSNEVSNEISGEISNEISGETSDENSEKASGEASNEISNENESSDNVENKEPIINDDSEENTNTQSTSTLGAVIAIIIVVAVVAIVAVIQKK